VVLLTDDRARQPPESVVPLVRAAHHRRPGAAQQGRRTRGADARSGRRPLVGNPRACTLLQNNIDIAVGADGYVALDPGAESQQVPVACARRPGRGRPRWRSRTCAAVDDEDPRTDFLRCSGRAVSVPDGAETVYLYSGLALTDATWPYQPTPVRLTDDTWTSGVNNADAAFFVPDSQQNLDALEDATRVRYSDGEVRRITSVVRTSPYINVYLDGPPLDPETAGYPNVFELLP
jgi:hypothetical protein